MAKSEVERLQDQVCETFRKRLEESFKDGLAQGYNLAYTSMAREFVIPMLESKEEEKFAEIAQKMCQVVIYEAEHAAKLKKAKVEVKENKTEEKQ